MNRKTCRYCKKIKNTIEFKIKPNGKPKSTCISCMKRESTIVVKLNKSTTEQYQIIREIFEGKDVKVDAVAGSGKTTSILHIAKNFGSSKICVITYNKKLQEETSGKILKYNINNISIFTYHGSCNSKYVGENKLITDREIRDTTKNDTEPKNDINYDIIIIDEVQDMNRTYYLYVKKFIRDNKNKDANIVILGDKNQCINQYNGSDERFLIYGDEILDNGREWVSLKLTETFRVPQEICDFLNHCMLKEERMISNDGSPNGGKMKYSGYKPRYFLKNSFTNPDAGCDYILREIDYYLELENPNGTKKYKPDDLFILSPSVKNKVDNKSPIIKLANALSSNYGSKRYIYINNDVDCVVEDKILKNKIVLSTHNSVKGLERKVVIIINFDNSYFNYYDTESKTTICPNRLYVAVTRSMERLSLFHHYKDGYLPFLLGKTPAEKEENIRKYCDFNPITIRPGEKFKLCVKEKEIEPTKYAVTDLVKHLNVEVIDKLTKLYELIEIPSKRKHGILQIEGLSEQGKDHWEIVSDINGTAIPLYFAITECNATDINETDISLNGVNDNINILKIANLTNAMVDNSYYKVNQIKQYNWLPLETLDSGVSRLKGLKDEGYISDSGSFEIPIGDVFETSESEEFILNGQMDYADEINKKVIEFKCVAQLDDSHFLQTLLYKYINGEDYDNYYVYNIKSDELYELKSSSEKLQKIIDILIDNKKYFRLPDPEWKASLNE